MAQPELDASTIIRDLAWSVHRRIPVLDDFHPLALTELGVLKHILEAPGITVTQLSRVMGLQQSNTSSAVRILTDKGLVTREENPEDRRVFRLMPTEVAIAENQTIASAWSGAIRQALGRLDAKQVKAINDAAKALRALDQAMRE